MTSDSERQKAITTLAEMIKEIGVAMLTTIMPDGTLRSRPMISAEPEFDGDLWFFTELAAPKVEEIQQNTLAWIPIGKFGLKTSAKNVAFCWFFGKTGVCE